MVKVVISKSDKAGKKLKAVFTRDNGREKTVHFGQAGAEDYTLTKDKEQRKRYRARHQKDLKTGDYMRPGYLSYHVLWGDSTSLATNIKAYKKKYKLK